MDTPNENLIDRPTRVVVIARQAVARLGWRELLAESADLQVVGVAGLESSDAVRDLRPSAVLAVDGGDDLTAIAQLAADLAESGVPVVVVGPLPTTGLASLLRAGVRGILPDTSGVDEVAAALGGAARGLLVLAPALGGSIVAALGRGPEAQVGASTEVENLTEREAEVLDLMALGLANKAIARRLGISEHTVKFHVGSVLAKLGAASRTEAVATALRRGLSLPWRSRRWPARRRR